MNRLWPQVRSLWQALWRSRRLDADMRDEMRFHLDMETDRLMRAEGLAPQEARRQARVRFGGVEKYTERGRDVRGVQWIDALSVDGRLALRMLVKHRGLTIVGGFAMAVAIAIGATFFEALTQVLDPALPLEEGHRVVGVQYATSIPGSPERRVLHDFVALRTELTSMEQLSAYRTVQHNLLAANAAPEPIRVAEMTASGFAVARTPPVIGRYLVPADERPNAAPVIVLGHQAWKSRFGGDAGIVGRAIELDGVSHEIVGVMPEGFAFPVDHHFWIPLRLEPQKYKRLEGPELRLFGRLTGGVTLARAQTELSTIGQRNAAAYPETYRQLRLTALPYTLEHFELTAARIWLLKGIRLLVGALAFVVAVNLAILFYARTVTRLGEIAVRTALGASRRRILAQLFVEAFALTSVGAISGLLLAEVALQQYQSLIVSTGSSLPFWIDLDLSGGAVGYGLGVAAAAAVVMGVLPGVKATGKSLTASLHDLGGRSGTRLGPVWTTLVVAQIAVAVAVLPAAVFFSWQMLRMELEGPGFAAEQFVVGTIALGGETSGVDAARSAIRERHLALVSRLERDPGVSAVTFSSGVPGFAGGRWIRFDDGARVVGDGIHEVSTLDVDRGLFDAYGAVLLAGRSFTAADVGAAHHVIVNRTFVREFLVSEDSGPALGDAGALGVRFRYSRAHTPDSANEAPSEWYQIVGVVRDFPAFSPAPGWDGEPTVYHPTAPGDIHPVVVSVRFKGRDPEGVIDRFRKIGGEVDPAMQMRRVVLLKSFYDEVRSFWRYLAWGLGLLTASVLLLSAAGMYALMSFTVAQRTREIGIRAALGAAPLRLVLSIFGRVFRQLALGLLVGSLLASSVFLATDLSLAQAAALLSTVAAIMIIVGVFAAFGPARRTLRIQAVEALRTDG
jgi:predicted permease